MDVNRSLNQYKSDMMAMEVESASPHRLIQMLFEGALRKIAAAKHFMGQEDIAQKGENISAAISIITVLQGSLDMEEGPDVVNNLSALYEYMMTSLFDANLKNDVEALDTITYLLTEIKEAWDEIDPDKQEQADEKK